MKLSKNFSHTEIFGKDEWPTDTQLQTACRLATTILQPIRDFHGKPLLITSGYRTPEHNKKIGGSPTSEHTWQGYAGAVDFSVPNHNDRLDVYEFCMENLKYSIGQLIWYVETGHLHVSIANKKQSDFLICTQKNTHSYARIEDVHSILEKDNRFSNA